MVVVGVLVVVNNGKKERISFLIEQRLKVALMVEKSSLSLMGYLFIYLFIFILVGCKLNTVELN